MNTFKNTKLSSFVLGEAAQWFVEFSAGDVDAAGRERFDGWLRRSPENVRAYLQILAFWEDASFLEKSRALASEELIAHALNGGNVVALRSDTRVSVAPAQTSAESHMCPESVSGQPAEYQQEEPGKIIRQENSLLLTGSEQQPRAPAFSPQRIINRTYVFAASIAVIAAGLAAYFYIEKNSYSTEIGEQRSISLLDGSTVDLNSDSRIRVRYTDGERRVELLEGEALFRVAKDYARPFVVQANGTRVRAVGTQFDVYRKHTGVVVTVIDGRVAVGAEVSGASPTRSQETSGKTQSSTSDSRSAPERRAPRLKLRNDLNFSARDHESGASASERRASFQQSSLRLREGEILLAAGEQVTATASGVKLPQRADLAAATAWTRHQLIFNATPLSAVIQEFNRYNPRRLTILDSGLKAVRISGVFSSTDPEPLLQFLRELPNVRIEEDRTEIRILTISEQSL